MLFASASASAYVEGYFGTCDGGAEPARLIYARLAFRE
jgi:hypothetical protein